MALWKPLEPARWLRAQTSRMLPRVRAPELPQARPLVPVAKRGPQASPQGRSASMTMQLRRLPRVWVPVLVPPLARPVQPKPMEARAEVLAEGMAPGRRSELEQREPPVRPAQRTLAPQTALVPELEPELEAAPALALLQPPRPVSFQTRRPPVRSNPAAWPRCRTAWIPRSHRTRRRGHIFRR